MDQQPKEEMQPTSPTQSLSHSAWEKYAFLKWPIIIGIFLLVGVPIVVYTLSLEQSNQAKQDKMVPPLAPTSTQQPSPTIPIVKDIVCEPINTPKTDYWEIYKNAKHKLCFKFPPTVKISSQGDNGAGFSPINYESSKQNFPDYSIEFGIGNIGGTNSKEFNIAYDSPGSVDIPKLHHAENAYVYKIKNFTVENYPAVEFISDNTAPGGHEPSYFHYIMVKKNDHILTFRSGAFSKAEQQKHEKEFMQMINTLTFVDQEQVIKPTRIEREVEAFD